MDELYTMPKLPMAGSAGELARQGTTELGQHQVHSLGHDLEQLGPERHGDLPM